jgi:6-phosphofructokinase 1
VAEGVGEKLDPEELKTYSGIEVSYDPYGHVTLADIPLGGLIRQRVQRRFAARGESMRLTDVTLGYELRCRDPIPFDIDYTRTLGDGAVQFLLREPEDERLRLGGFISLEEGHLNVLAFDDLIDHETGRTRVRLVDLDSLNYSVARDYMIRLEPENLNDPEMVNRLAQAARMSPDDFAKEFSQLWQPEGALTR